MRRSISLAALAIAAAGVIGGCDDDANELRARLTHRSGAVLDMSIDGSILDVKTADGRSWYSPNASSRIEVAVGETGATSIACDLPTRWEREGSVNAVWFEYDLRPRAPLIVRERVSLVDVPADSSFAVKREIDLRGVDETGGVAPIHADVRVVVHDGVAARAQNANDELRPRNVFIPHQDGFGENAVGGATALATALVPERKFIFAFAGTKSFVPSDAVDLPERLAIPMVSEALGGGAADDQRVTHVADVTFTTAFAADPTHRGAWTFDWTYRGKEVPLEHETRVLYDVIHQGSREAAMQSFYATALADVPVGPSWLHDIAWQHYDYMSHGGRGWFEDIDVLAARLSLEERSHVLVTLHGWFDVYGRYTFSGSTRQLADSWTVFPNAASVDPKVFPDSQTIPMTKSEVHRRIAYAKTRGFRLGLYFGDGTATGEDVTALFAPERALSRGGWQGPDTTSTTWTLDPGHPDVARYFHDYLDALLEEYGTEIDALVWDETFLVHIGAIGMAPTPHYADRAMMTLTRELTQRVTQYRSDLAFLTSDSLGTPADLVHPMIDVPPYALMAHGTYQDSWSHPLAWGYGIFPNYRNTLWSCNWHAVTNFEYDVIGVESVQAPVATSNGFGDNLGIAALDTQTRDRFFDLFAKRMAMGRQSLHWKLEH